MWAQQGRACIPILHTKREPGHTGNGPEPLPRGSWHKVRIPAASAPAGDRPVRPALPAAAPTAAAAWPSDAGGEASPNEPRPAQCWMPAWALPQAACKPQARQHTPALDACLGAVAGSLQDLQAWQSQSKSGTALEWLDSSTKNSADQWPAALPIPLNLYCARVLLSSWLISLQTLHPPRIQGFSSECSLKLGTPTAPRPPSVASADFGAGVQVCAHHRTAAAQCVPQTPPVGHDHVLWWSTVQL